MKTSLNINQAGKIIGLLLTGILFGWLFFGSSGGEVATNMDQHIEKTHTDEEGKVVYTCSMHPQIRQNEPGNCPICGMELIPMDEAENQEETTFTMTEAAVKLADIQTTRVDRRTPEIETRLPGRVAVDERRISSITAQFSGRIDELYVDFTGTYVEKGEKLAAIYSPELISAQRELLEAAKNKETDPVMYESTLRKFRLWGLPESEIQRIESSGEITDQIPIVATQNGYVTQKNVDVEDYVDEGTVMYKVADLSRLWVLFDAYETDISAIDQGDSVDFTVRSYPGKNFEAEITYVDPFIDPETRTARVRAEVENSDGTLKPEMLARGKVRGAADNGEKLMVPRSAVMWTGKRSIVFVKQSEREIPTFEPRLVTLGQRAGNFYVIEEGLEAGEQVVTHGNFKLDSAAQLADNLSMMNRETTSAVRKGVDDHGEVNIKKGNIIVDTTSVHTNNRAEINNHSSDVSEKFREQLKSAVEVYLDLKNSLVESDSEDASDKAVELLRELEKVDMTLLEEGSRDRWAEQLDRINEEAKSIVDEAHIENQRKSFFALSELMVTSIREFGIDEVIYYQFCPMAFNGEGAYWLSEEKEIRNPYLGEEMLECGEIIQEIEI